ncbi:hypothetical protein [Actinocrispum sp. NPDC049592]|uniref:hypothetical protein n=1 Tax=Actinocrispum sp. NPDC049592 TaxID=3154835 RepID=UPI0034220E53
MPERAVYVLLDDYGWQRYAAGSRAAELDLDLAAGPASALRRIREQQKTEQWSDDVWCESAVLVDQPHKVLLFFTTHTTGYAHRAALLTTLAHTWPEWEVRWAYDGLADLLAYLGLDRAEVRTEHSVIDPAAAEDDPDQLVSVVRESGEIDAYAVRPAIDEVLALGPECVDLLPEDAKVTECDLPRSGVHIDIPAKTIGLWTMDAFCGLPDKLAWPGWQVGTWADRYPDHLEKCKVTCPEWHLTDGLRTLVDRARALGSRPAQDS